MPQRQEALEAVLLLPMHAQALEVGLPVGLPVGLVVVLVVGPGSMVGVAGWVVMSSGRYHDGGKGGSVASSRAGELPPGGAIEEVSRATVQGHQQTGRFLRIICDPSRLDVA